MNAPKDIAWIKSYRTHGANMYIEDVTSGTGVISVMGRNSQELLKSVTRFDEELDFPFGTFKEIDIGYARTRACRITYVGELGWELHTPSDQMTHVYKTIIKAGEKYNIKNCGYYSIDSLRIESGYKAWSHELTMDENPKECGLMFAVDMSKPFIGKEALEKCESTKRLVAIRLRDPNILIHGGEPLLHDGKFVGHITSAAYGYTVQSSVGFGFVDLGEKLTQKNKKITKKEKSENINEKDEREGETSNEDVNGENNENKKWSRRNGNKD
eukprot:UN23553